MYPKSLEQRISELKIRNVISNDIMTFNCFFFYSIKTACASIVSLKNRSIGLTNFLIF